MSLTQVTDHVDQAVGKLLSHYRELPKFTGWQSAFVDEIQELENMFFQLLLQRFLSSAVGAQLDLLGRIIGRTRLGLEDGDYKLLLFAWIRANRSSGTGDDVIEVLQLALQGADIEFRPMYPAGFVVEVIDALDADPAILALVVAKARLAGVGAQVVYADSDFAHSFVAADADTEQASTTQGTASGDDDSSGTGGLLGDALGA